MTDADPRPIGKENRSVDRAPEHEHGRAPRLDDRALQGAAAAGRRWHGHGLYGRAGEAGPPPRRAQDHQAGHGQPGMSIARFEAERQALALMNHIQRGQACWTPGHDRCKGRPYFVMELVKGIPITDYCDRQPTSRHRRAARTCSSPVCQAVQHAHTEGDHPSRHQAVEHPDHASRRAPRPQGHRLRHRQGHRSQRLTERTLFTALRPDDRYAGVHEPRADRDERVSTWTPGADIYSLGVHVSTSS